MQQFTLYFHVVRFIFFSLFFFHLPLLRLSLSRMDSMHATSVAHCFEFQELPYIFQTSGLFELNYDLSLDQLKPKSSLRDRSLFMAGGGVGRI